MAVLLPCYNEELTVAKCVADFQKALPEAVVYVFDNNSTDKTAALAEAAGAVVVTSRRQGKGFVVQHMCLHAGWKKWSQILLGPF